jgi:hypothetical protein
MSINLLLIFEVMPQFIDERKPKSLLLAFKTMNNYFSDKVFILNH